MVQHRPQHEFFKRLSSSTKEKHVLAGFYHDTLGELDREKAFELIWAFLDKVDRGTQPQDLYLADKQGYTFNEYQTLLKPLPCLHPKNWYYGLTRFSLNTLGKNASKGMRIGAETGFDSGSSLDYVYKNKAQGIGILGALGIGKMIDKGYLESIGWKGIRVRKINLEALIGKCIEDLHSKNIPVRLVDIASGHGRYILDAITPYYDRIEQVLLRDYSDINVKAGLELIWEKKLEQKVHFVLGNAFDEESLAQLTPAPTIAVVSGLYELFPENNLLKSSLSGLARTVPLGGYLVYTNQP